MRFDKKTAGGGREGEGTITLYSVPSPLAYVNIHRNKVSFQSHYISISLTIIGTELFKSLLSLSRVFLQLFNFTEKIMKTRDPSPPVFITVHK